MKGTLYLIIVYILITILMLWVSLLINNVMATICFGISLLCSTIGLYYFLSEKLNDYDKPLNNGNGSEEKNKKK